MSQMHFSEAAILLHQTDNVAVLKRTLKRGDELTGPVSFRVSQNVPAGHKIAVYNISSGEVIKKYGQMIGIALADILPGEHVHTHNLILKEASRHHEFCVD